MSPDMVLDHHDLCPYD